MRWTFSHATKWLYVLLTYTLGFTLSSCNKEVDRESIDKFYEEDKEITNENFDGENNPEYTTSIVNLALDKATSTKAFFYGHINVPSSDLPFCHVLIYYSEAEIFSINEAKKAHASSFDEEQDFSIILTELKPEKEYKYCVVTEAYSEIFIGEINSFTTEAVTVDLVNNISTATTARINGIVSGIHECDRNSIEIGLIYRTDDNGGYSDANISIMSRGNNVLFDVNNLDPNTKYYCYSYIKYDKETAYTDTLVITTKNISIDINIVESDIIAKFPIAEFQGCTHGFSSSDYENLQIGVAYSYQHGDLKSRKSKKISATVDSTTNTFRIYSDYLSVDTKYYYCSYIKHHDHYIYGEIKEFKTWHPYSIK